MNIPLEITIAFQSDFVFSSLLNQCPNNPHEMTTQGTDRSRRLSIPVSTMEYWLKAAQIGKLGDVGKTQRSLTKTKRELSEIKIERDLLKNGGVLCQGSAVKYAMMKKCQRDYPVPFICHIYDISTTRY
ncbi:MAG: hypothetical protein ABIR84_02445 [Candidatus Nitrotoga sp.]